MGIWLWWPESITFNSYFRRVSKFMNVITAIIALQESSISVHFFNILSQLFDKHYQLCGCLVMYIHILLRTKNKIEFYMWKTRTVCLGEHSVSRRSVIERKTEFSTKGAYSLSVYGICEAWLHCVGKICSCQNTDINAKAVGSAELRAKKKSQPTLKYQSQSDHAV